MDSRQAWYAGVCPTCGLEVSAPGVETRDTPRLEFAGGPTISLPAYARWPIVRHGGGLHVVMASGQDGIAYLVSGNGDVHALGRVFGAQSTVGWTADDRPCWQDSLTTYRVMGEAASRPIPLASGSVLGWSGDPEQARHWFDAQNLSPVVQHGARFYNASYSPDGRWSCGFTDGPDLLVYDAADDALYTAGPGSTVPPQLVLVAGSPVIVRSYPSGLIPREQWQVYTGPPARAVRVAPWPSPVTLGAWKLLYEHNGGAAFATADGLPYQHAICETSEGVQRANPRGLGVIAAADLIGVAMRPVAVLAYASDGAGAAMAVAASKGTADAYDLPLFVYVDQLDPSAHIPANLPAAAVLSWPWYTTPAESRDALRARVRAGVAACWAAGVRAIAPTLQAFDRAQSWPTNALADLTGDLLDLARECGDLLVGLECFAYGRQGGVIDHPEILAWHRASAEASPAGSHWPKPSDFATPQPQPEQPPATAPPDTPDTPDPPPPIEEPWIAPGAPGVGWVRQGNQWVRYDTWQHAKAVYDAQQAGVAAFQANLHRGDPE